MALNSEGSRTPAGCHKNISKSGTEGLKTGKNKESMIPWSTDYKMHNSSSNFPLYQQSESDPITRTAGEINHFVWNNKSSLKIKF